MKTQTEYTPKLEKDRTIEDCLTSSQSKVIFSTAIIFSWMTNSFMYLSIYWITRKPSHWRKKWNMQRLMWIFIFFKYARQVI